MQQTTGHTFTWSPRLTEAVERVPEEYQRDLLRALARYGTYGVEPELSWPLDAIFEALRETVDDGRKPVHAWRCGSGNRKPLPPRIRYEVFERDGYTCQYFGAKAPDVTLHVDHIVPVSDGGTDDLSNLVTACEYCNIGKSNLPTSRFKGGACDGRSVHGV